MEYNGNVEDYVLETNKYIKEIINNRKSIFSDCVEYFCDKKIEQFYLVGAGTSYHAHLASKKLIEKLLNIPVLALDSVVFNDSTKIFNKNSLVLSSSHGGSSTSAINSLKKAKELGVPCISSTAVHNSKITEYGDKILYCEIGEENAGPKTKGYNCAIITDIVFGLEIALKQGKITEQEQNTYFERIIKTADNIPNIAKSTNNWYKKHSKELLSCKRLVVVGYGNNLPTCIEGTLKLLEAVRFGVTGYEIEQFMHGIYHSIWEDDYMFYIGSKEKDYEKMIRMEKYFEERTKHNFIFTSDKKQDNGKNFIADFVDDEDFSFLEYIIPFQILTALWSKDLGINCNIPSDVDFHKKMGSYTFK